MMGQLVTPNLRLDFKALREQKAELVRVIAFRHANSKVRNDADILDGIVHLLDEIQDQAVASGTLTELQVFGNAAATARECRKDTTYMAKQDSDVKEMWENWQTETLRIFQTRTHKTPESFGIEMGKHQREFLRGFTPEEFAQQLITANKITTVD